jgi:hypothetical protein
MSGLGMPVIRAPDVALVASRTWSRTTNTLGMTRLASVDGLTRLTDGMTQLDIRGWPFVDGRPTCSRSV